MRRLALIVLLFVSATAAFAEEYSILSPDKRIAAVLKIGRTVSIVLREGTEPLFSVDSLVLRLDGEPPFGIDARVQQTHRQSRDTLIHPSVREKRASIREHYNELRAVCSGGWEITVRAYDEGIAYRFTTSLPRPVLVRREGLSLVFPERTRVTYQASKEFWSAYENPYQTTSLEKVPPDSLAALPILAELGNGRKVLFTEARIEEYPGLWFRGTGSNRLSPAFPGYPLELLESEDHYTRGKVTRHADEIARTQGNRAYPWRVAILSRNDGDLLRSQLVYLLGEPSRLKDVSWISPGMVTLDWWARRNVQGVDFAAGVNTATAKYLIDFAAHYGIKYFLLDEGWSKDEDLLSINPDLDLEAVAAYAKKKGVHILLWAVWSTLERQWDAAFAMFSRLGAAGIKVDFMNRDDQLMVRFYYRVAEETARRKMIAMFHGAYKPDGLRRTYPNVITREGLIEFEQNSVNLTDSPDYHVRLPFIRMVAGPADYLPGTVNNAQPDEFRMVIQRPMGQGTRAHSMALCVILESPVRMFPDSPPDYYREDACTRFMADIPVEWDDLRVIDARFGEAVAVARRRGERWYAGVITGSAPRTLEIDCSFLEVGKTYTMVVFRDGVNAGRRATDYAVSVETVTSASRIPVTMARGGGWVARFSPVR